jgi:hypothetical protein
MYHILEVLHVRRHGFTGEEVHGLLIYYFCLVHTTSLTHCMFGNMASPGKKNMGHSSIYYFISGTHHILDALHVWQHGFAREEVHGSLFYILLYLWYVPHP